MYALLSAPGLFDSYIVADPSFWWDNGFMDTLAIKNLKKITGLRSLYLTGRAGNAYHEMGIDVMDSLLRVHTPANLLWKTNAYEQETHVSAQFKSAYDGLKYAYTGYKKDTIQLTPMGGIVVPGMHYMVRYDEAFARVGFTTDGSEPTEASPKMQDTPTLEQPARLTIRSLCFHPGQNKSSRADFVTGRIWTPQGNAKSKSADGLHYAYYAGNWDSLPAFEQLHPLRSGTAGRDLDIDSLQNEKKFALLLNGLLEIRKDGYSTFVLSAEDAAAFYLNNRRIIRKSAGGGDSQSYLLPLTKGFYPLRFEYLHRQGTFSFNLTWYTPESKGGDPVSIPLDQLHSSR